MVQTLIPTLGGRRSWEAAQAPDTATFPLTTSPGQLHQAGKSLKKNPKTSQVIASEILPVLGDIK